MLLVLFNILLEVLANKERTKEVRTIYSFEQAVSLSSQKILEIIQRIIISLKEFNKLAVLYTSERVECPKISCAMVTNTIMRLGINFQKCAKPELRTPQNLHKDKKGTSGRHRMFLDAKSQQCKNVSYSTN